MGQCEQACKPKYKGYFQTYTLKREVVKKSLRAKRRPRNIQGYFIVENKHIFQKKVHCDVICTIGS